MDDGVAMGWAIGIDLGGTKCAAGLVSLPDGNLLERKIVPTLPERGGEAVLIDVIELVRQLKAQSQRPTKIGLAICELVGRDGQLLSDATIKWLGISAPQRLQKSTGLGVVFEADVRAAARAEAYLGAGQGFDSFLYVTIGTGISACIVLNKTPYLGAHGLTGTFASSRGLIPGDTGELISGPPLEQFAAGPAIAARFAAVCPSFKGAAPEVIMLAEAGEPEARAIVSSAAESLGAAIAQLVNILDPQAIVLGGGLGLVEGNYRKSLLQALRVYVWSELHQKVPLLSAKLRSDAGVIGAALAAAYSQADSRKC